MRMKTTGALMSSKNVFPESGQTAHCAQRRRVHGPQKEQRTKDKDQGTKKRECACEKQMEREREDESAFGVKGQKNFFSQ